MYHYPPNYENCCTAELDLALGRVPAYANWRGLAGAAGQAVDARFAALPLLTKADLRQWSLAGFVAPGHDLPAALARHEISVVHTSGTTDERVELLWNQAWWDASERASWQLNSHARDAGLDQHNEAILTCPLSTGVRTTDGKMLDMAARRLQRFLYLNEFFDARDWTDDLIRRMCDEMSIFQPVVLEANPTLLARFARRLLALGLTCHQPRLIVLTYEMPSRVHLRQIQRAFGCPVASSHGCTEAGYVFMECEAGCFHQNSAFARVEFQSMKAQSVNAGLGRIALTTFENPWRVLVRFDVGDIVRLRPSAQPCACGRHDGMVLDAIEGRAKDVTFDARNQPVTVGQLDRAMIQIPDLLEYKLTQTAPDRYAADVVFETDETRGAADVRARLRELYGTGDVQVRNVPAIAPEISGKYRLSQCKLPFDAADLFDGPMQAV